MSETAVLREGHDDLVGKGDYGAVSGDAIDYTGGLLGPRGEGGFCHGVHLMSGESDIYRSARGWNPIREELRLNRIVGSWQSLMTETPGCMAQHRIVIFQLI